MSPAASAQTFTDAFFALALSMDWDVLAPALCSTIFACAAARWGPEWARRLCAWPFLPSAGLCFAIASSEGAWLYAVGALLCCPPALWASQRPPPDPMRTNLVDAGDGSER